MGRRLALGVSVALLLLATFCRATTTSGTQKTIEDDGLNLEEALIGDGDDSKKPAPAPPRPKPGSHGNTGDDGFNLEEALMGDGDDSKKPAPAPAPPRPKPGSHGNTGDDGFNLDEALMGDGDDSKKPAPAPPRPKPGSHGNTGEFSDSDLYDGELPPEKPRSGGQDPAASEGSQGMLAGIVSSVVVAIVGALSSFIAYQKKKLCFKASDQENVHMESQQGIHAEPPVQRTLLQKQ